MPARPIHDEAKVLVNHGVLGIGVSAAQPQSASRPVLPLVAGFGLKPMVGSIREPASGSPTASVFKSTHFDPARAGPLASLVLEDAWTEGNIGPPGQETHGPPKPIGICRLPVKDGSSKQQRATLPQGIYPLPTEF